MGKGHDPGAESSGFQARVALEWQRGQPLPHPHNRLPRTRLSGFRQYNRKFVQSVRNDQIRNPKLPPERTTHLAPKPGCRLHAESLFRSLKLVDPEQHQAEAE